MKKMLFWKFSLDKNHICACVCVCVCVCVSVCVCVYIFVFLNTSFMFICWIAFRNLSRTVVGQELVYLHTMVASLIETVYNIWFGIG